MSPSAPASWTRARRTRVVSTMLFLGLLQCASAACQAQGRGARGGADRGAVTERVKELVDEIESARKAGYDVTAAEGLLGDLRAALAQRDRAEAQRIGARIRQLLADAPRQAAGTPVPSAKLWSPLTVGPGPTTWERSAPRFGLLDAYMNTGLPLAQRYVRDLGVQWVRLGAPRSGALNWGTVERTPGRFTWGHTDSILDLARAAGVEPMITLGITNPRDAASCGGGRKERQLPCNMQAYKAFVRAAATRYSGRVRAWQVWNEPDDTGHWDDTPEHYADLVIATSDAIREADPAARVVLAGMRHREFLEAVVARLVRVRPRTQVVDAFDVHFFGVVRNGGSSVQRLFTSYREIQPLVEMYRQVTRGTIYAQAPLWATETATYSDAPGQRWPPQAERDQARDLVRRFAFSFAVGVERVSWASLVEWTTWRGRNVEFNHVGLVRNPAHGAGSSPKLAYSTYRHLIERVGDFTSVSRLDAPSWVTALRFSTPGGPVLVVWYDRWASGSPATLTVRLRVDGSRATVERAVPAQLPRGLKPATFSRSIMPVHDGVLTLQLGDDPVYVLSRF